MRGRNHCPPPRLNNAKGQIFSCGIFGTCSDSVLSPRTPPPLIIHHKQQHQHQLQQQQQPQQQQQQQQRSSENVIDKNHEKSEWLKQYQQQSDRVKERYVGLVDRDLSPFQVSHQGGRVLKHQPLHAELPNPEQSHDDHPLEVLDLKNSVHEKVEIVNVHDLINEITSGRVTKQGLEKLRQLGEENDKSKVEMVNAGIVGNLICLLTSPRESMTQEKYEMIGEAFGLVAMLADGEEIHSRILESRGMLSILEKELKKRSMNAGILLCKISTGGAMVEAAATSIEGILEACCELLRDTLTDAKLVRMVLKSMLGICLNKPNRANAVKAGAVGALLETLRDLGHGHGLDCHQDNEFSFSTRSKGCTFNFHNVSSNRRNSSALVNVERALAILELLCTSPEGRMAVCKEPGSIAQLVGLVLGVSERATEYAAGVLCAVLCDGDGGTTSGIDADCKENHSLHHSQSQSFNGFMSNAGVGGGSVQEVAVKGGAPAQMLLVMQSECSDRARRKAAKLLKALHKYGEDHTIHSDLASTITY